MPHLQRSSALALLALPLLAAAPRIAGGQTRADDTSGRLRVSVDCLRLHCDRDFLREQIAFVDHVRDRQVADVHVLVTAEGTAAGGRDHAIELVGRGRFAGAADTLHFVTAADVTEDELRRGLARRIAAGLAPFVARTSAVDRLRIAVEGGDSSATASAGARTPPAADPWNHWVFRPRLNANLNGEKSQRSFSGFGSISANRTTEAWKVGLTLTGNYSESKFDFSGGRFTSYGHSFGANALVVRSLGGHWAAGGRLSASSATRTNQALLVRLAPAVEYNFFPYAEGTRRQLTLQYSVGASRVRYDEVTIFDRRAESLADEALVLSYDVKQPWGSISTSVEGAHYFHDPSKWRAVSFTSMDVRLVRGLSFNMFGSASILRDQLYLARGDIPPEEVLLQRRQLATSYRYFAGLGLSYTFGSIYNNVVNTRFQGSSGGVVFF